MSGTGLPCKAHWGEEFGRSIIPLGDVNGDAIADFILERSRCDTGFGPNQATRANELLLYYGTKGRLPASSSGKRLGNTELGSITQFLCSGDFNNDRYVDLVCSIHMFNDTSQGPTGRTIGYVVVFWGNATANYSVDDTSHLQCDAPLWLMTSRGIALDLNNDAIQDLLVKGTGSGFAAGELVKIPRVYIFYGEAGTKWHKPSPPRRDRWWNAPSVNTFVLLDQDCDGTKDLLYYQSSDPYTIMVAYQNSMTPTLDTSEVETITLAAVQGHAALFQDVTGDKVPELITLGGNFEQGRIRIFAGAPGQRLKEQYGSGSDSADRANNRFPLRPWAQIMSPNALHEGWFDWENFLFDLGDVNDDGTSEIVAFSKPFLLFYTTGNTLDSLIDIMFQVPSDSWATIRRMGDVDGSGKVSYAVNFAEKIHFLKAPPKDEIPTYGGRIRSLPHPRDFRCEQASSVQEQPAVPTTLDLTQQGLLFPGTHSFYHHR
ncbi:MAG: hypothetical protein IT211_01285 [Armatimonadetes bacterium]|nr:hypothetical protein [Armatimonadota bacterium]